MAPARIAVVGGGLMGHGLAQVFATAGHPVALTDASPAVRASVPRRVAANLAALGHPGCVSDVTDRITVCERLADCVADADYVIEAIPEDRESKRALFRTVQELAPPDAILATNTSVIPVGEVTVDVIDGARAVGTHWWNPPYLVPLVEVVQAQRTSERTMRATIALLESVGKRPVWIRRDIPGFVGNRLQHALWREAIALVASGVCDAATVDQVVTSSFGPRLGAMGPLETAELIGLDLTLSIHEHVLPDLDRSPGPSPLLRELVGEGKLGMKTGRGFREWGPQAADDAREQLLRHLLAAGTFA